MQKLLHIILFFTIVSLAYAEPLSEVKSFAYQLQNIKPSELAASPYDLIIMDYSSDGSSSGEFTKEKIDVIHKGKSGRIVVAYMSIGEAEDYRFYFKSNWVRNNINKKCGVRLSSHAPDWLDLPNPNFCGNYKVRYWEPSWKQLIFGKRSGNSKSYLDRIIDAGFKGVYLDIIDGYEYWKYEKRKSERHVDAATDMANLVIEISRYARKTRGVKDFVVIPQNGAGILDEISSALRKKYLAAIDGIGAEDTFYFGDNDEDNLLDPQENTIKDLKRFINVGKKVFAIDYLTEQTNISDFKSRACSEGFIPQVSVRELDSLSTQIIDSCL